MGQFVTGCRVSPWWSKAYSDRHAQPRVGWLEIDLTDAIEDKLTVIVTRGWKEGQQHKRAA